MKARLYILLPVHNRREAFVPAPYLDNSSTMARPIASPTFM